MAKSQFTKRKNKFFVIISILVAVFAIAAGIGIHFYFGHTFEASDISDSLSDKMSIGSSFTVDEILENEKYSYGWMKSNIDVQIVVKKSTSIDQTAELTIEESKEGEYIVTNDVLEYNSTTRTFSVCGIGNGFIDFKNPMDSSVSLQVPFCTKFAIEDTALIIKENYPKFFEDDLILKEEIESIDEIRLTTPRSYNIAELAMCSNLYRFILSSEDLLNLEGIDKINSNVIFYVKDGLYTNYMTASSWSRYANRIFPILDLSVGIHRLVFDFKGGQMLSEGTEVTHYFSTVDDGESIDLNKYIVKRTGYTFLGWYTSNDNGKTLNTRIDEGHEFKADTKLYANWRANEYEIVYHDSYSTALPNNQKIKYDQSATISNEILKRTGYTFIGWSFTNGSKTVELEPGKSIINLAIEEGKKIDLYAVWAANSYTIVFNGNGVGVTNVPARQSDIPFDTEVTLREGIPQWTGYTFIGWSMNKAAKDFEYEPGQTVKNLISDSDGQVILYAIWSANNYSIHYDPNGGANAPADQNNLVYGEKVKLSSTIPTWTGRVFLGWSREEKTSNASWKAGTEVQNLVSDAGGIITLYAVWTYDSFRIQYDANGGNNAPATSSYIYYNSESAFIAEGKPDRIGHNFTGWSYTPSGSVDFKEKQELNQSEINEMYIKSGSSKIIVLYACWSVKSYKIEWKSTGEKGGTITGVENGAYYKYNTALTINISYKGDENKYIVVDGVNLGKKQSHSFNMPAKDIKIEVHSDQSCIAEGSLITMSNGTQKAVENIKVGDKILSWDFATQSFVETEVIILTYHGVYESRVINLSFDNGHTLRTIGDHVLFDMTDRKYVTVNADNYVQFIGHEFLCYDSVNNSYVASELIEAKMSIETTGVYSIVTAYYYNFIANNIVNSSPAVPGFYEWIVSYLCDDFTFDTTQFEADLQQYGTYEYDLFKTLMSYDQFAKLCGPYYKVVIGKGFTTWEILWAVMSMNSDAYQ